MKNGNEYFTYRKYIYFFGIFWSPRGIHRTVHGAIVPTNREKVHAVHLVVGAVQCWLPSKRREDSQYFNESQYVATP